MLYIALSSRWKTAGVSKCTFISACAHLNNSSCPAHDWGRTRHCGRCRAADLHFPHFDSQPSSLPHSLATRGKRAVVKAGAFTLLLFFLLFIRRIVHALLRPLTFRRIALARPPRSRVVRRTFAAGPLGSWRCRWTRTHAGAICRSSLHRLVQRRPRGDEIPVMLAVKLLVIPLLRTLGAAKGERIIDQHDCTFWSPLTSTLRPTMLFSGGISRSASCSARRPFFARLFLVWHLKLLKQFIGDFIRAFQTKRRIPNSRYAQHCCLQY